MRYPPQLTLQLRKKQLTDIYGNNISFTGPNPMNLAQTIGSISNPWVDFTDFVSVEGKSLDESLVITTTMNETATGQAGAGQAVPKRGVTNSITFEKDAYEFIKAWLVDDVAAPLNQIDVQITDIANGPYTSFVIKSSALQWCEYNALCVYDIALKQQDELYQCIEKTMIADNWQGWFQDEPVTVTSSGTTPKYHPRFSYCVERRPNGVLIVEWYVSSIVGIIATAVFTVLWPFLATIHYIVVVINAIIAFINTLGASITPLADPGLPGSPLAVLDGWANMMLESAGCGREHIAPLIRDYITNVCDKCGVGYSAETADIFFAPIISIQKSDGAIYSKPNPHYNACYFFPQVERGIRRFRNWNLFTGFSAPDITTFYQPNNQPVLALSDFLNQLKKYYNAEWRIQGGMLYFKRKDWFRNDVPLYDFSIGGADRGKIVEGICYQPQDYTVPASMNGLYQDDPADKCGHEANHQMNGDPLSFNNTIVNPLFSGILDKNSGFAATRFNCDGAQTNYLYDALQVCWSFSGLALAGFALSDLASFIGKYADYALLLQTEAVSLPKILIWDGDTNHPSTPDFKNARAVRDRINLDGTVYTIGHSAYPGTFSSISTPDINTRYLSQVAPTPISISTLAAPSTLLAPLPWEQVNQPQTDVYGRVSSASPAAGVYEVLDYFGTVRLAAAACLVNYPAYFNPYFEDSLWDWFHWLDDPYRRPMLNKQWNLKIPLCKADLDKLGVLGDGRGAKLLNTVLLDSPYYKNGVIKEINVGYEVGGTNGVPQYIELKGEV